MTRMGGTAVAFGALALLDLPHMEAHYRWNTSL